MKENERLLLFYEECVKKGYSDMTDPQQALKAKVIATDRKLRYGNSIEQFFQKAKAAYKEREAERIAEKQRIAEETRRCAVPGEELVNRNFVLCPVLRFPMSIIRRRRELLWHRKAVLPADRCGKRIRGFRENMNIPEWRF